MHVHVNPHAYFVFNISKLQVSSNYEGIPRLCVYEYCKLCPICCCKKPQLTRAPLKPIVSKRFHGRGQVCKL